MEGTEDLREFATVVISGLEIRLNPNKKPLRLFVAIEYKGKRWEIPADDKEKQSQFYWPLHITIPVYEEHSSEILTLQIYKVEEFPRRAITKTWIKFIPIKDLVKYHCTIGEPNKQYITLIGEYYGQGVTDGSEPTHVEVKEKKSHVSKLLKRKKDRSEPQQDVEETEKDDLIYPVIKLYSTTCGVNHVLKGLKSDDSIDRKLALYNISKLIEVSKDREKYKENGNYNSMSSKIQGYITPDLLEDLSNLLDSYLPPYERRITPDPSKNSSVANHPSKDQDRDRGRGRGKDKSKDKEQEKCKDKEPVQNQEQNQVQNQVQNLVQDQVQNQLPGQEQDQ
eukprot:TRINITY_DN18233_c0_g1_i1.p1 TRINITY_DN18233_c0_g1~~TRINITY_DN18233_c0_g1_i1.p1  ORF type:complete len:352 (-),score=87.86 TRINITY_DN18233_c0_g1_i1:59-1069(-)